MIKIKVHTMYMVGQTDQNFMLNPIVMFVASVYLIKLDEKFKKLFELVLNLRFLNKL